MKESNNLVIYTGAGISTSASIPDYRGENGYWTLTDRGEKAPPCKDLTQALPTVGHMAIRSLVDAGICKLVVSTNIDGLHRRSGISADKVVELHGNCFKEQCKKCDKEYLRNFNCTTSKSGSHVTERNCDECGENLTDTIINFNESLNEEIYNKAEEFSKKADVSLVLGTSMLVAPANILPVKNPDNKLVIINRQKTPFDVKSEVRIFGDTDDALQLLMEELDIKIEQKIKGFEINFPSIEHDSKFEKFKPKLTQQQKESESKLQRKGGKFVLENVNEGVKVLSKNELVPSSLVYLENCSNMECVVDCMCAKIILHKLKDCKVSVRYDILTSCLEMIHCENVTVEVFCSTRTISIDNSSSCSLHFMKAGLMGSVYTCSVNDIKIAPFSATKPDFILPVIISGGDETEEGGLRQYITRMNTGNTLLTEEVIREGVGYATTVREKTAADEKEQKLLAALERVLVNDIVSRK